MKALMFLGVLAGAITFYLLVGFLIERLDGWLERRKIGRRTDALEEPRHESGVVVRIEDRRAAR